MLCKLESESFSQRNASIVSVIKGKKEEFKKLSKEQQCETILQIIKWLGVVCVGVDLSMLDASVTCGICRMNKKVSTSKELKLIFNSTTGLFEKTLDLLVL